MKITNIEVFDCELNKIDPKTKLNPVIIRINTDEGISGVGEVGLAYGRGCKAGAAIIRDLGPLFIGKDPMKIEALWEMVFRDTFWGMGGGPVFYGGLSALDIACWDIRGKAMNVPVYQLLGGKTKEKLRTYASQLQFGWGPNRGIMVTPEDYYNIAKTAVSEGFDAIKVDPLMIDKYGERAETSPEMWSHYGILPPDQLKMGVDRVAALRDAVGPNVDIIIEIHCYLGTSAAIQFGRAIEPYRIYFYEEPIHAMNSDNMELIARSVQIPLAAGERLYTRWGFRPLFEKHALGVIQPDMCLVGGFTEAKKVCDMANTYDVTVQAHACGGPVTTAAALHLEASIPNFIIHEHHVNALNKANISLCKYNYQPEDGKYSAPDLPGIGQELNDDVIGQFRIAVVDQKA